MDRIDLQVMVSRLKPEEITSQEEGESSEAVRARVHRARQIQQRRFANEPNVRCNAQMESRHLRQFCGLDDRSRGLLEGAIRRLGLSARASDRVLKVSRTIADLAESDKIQASHVGEAIQYRTFDRMNS